LIGLFDRRRSAVVSRLGAAALVAAVVLPVVSTVVGGSVGGRPGEHTVSTGLLRLTPAIEEAAREDDPVVVESGSGLNPATIGLAVILDRAGIDWVEPFDQAAIGHRRLDVWIWTKAEFDEQFGTAAEQGKIELVAWSGPPRPGEAPGQELLLVRSPPLEDVAASYDSLSD
jgi:hypothetical protein